MKKIRLNNRKKIEVFSLVSNEDFNLLNKYKWHTSSDGYARTQVSRGKFLLMHQLINNTPKGFDTDHINRNKLDNRRENLRTATRSLNNINSGLSIRNTSGHKGIDFYKRVKKWRVRISFENKNVSLGYFDDLKDAIQARKKGEELLWTH